MNIHEHRLIKTNNLPVSWRDKETLYKLECFLQQNWEYRSIFYVDNQVTSKQQFIDFEVRNGIKTKNYIGTIFFEGEQLNIFPKIFRTDEDDTDTDDLDLSTLVQNLVYWLGYCDRLNFPFVNMKSDFSDVNNLVELLITIYVHYIKSVIDNSRFYKYEDEVDLIGTVRGKIDFNDYVRNRLSRKDLVHFQCEYSNFLFDNKINQIIKHTLKTIFNLTEDTTNKNLIRNLLHKFSDVTDKSFTPYECDTIKLSRLNRQYIIIISMSKMFLLNKSIEFESGINNNFSFLFPAELLYEGFVGGYLKEVVGDSGHLTYQSTQNFLSEVVVDGNIIGNAFLLKEDIVVEIDETVFVVDSKYKGIDKLDNVFNNIKLGLSENDLRQIIIYALKREAKKVALIYPLYKNEELSDKSIAYNITIEHEGQNYKFPVYVIKVPFILTDSRVEKDKINKLLSNFFDI